ncbi:hypothetical protein TWF718_004361 [Orbilia javanica]|uniref:Uncharacterized protein n=1 Tax=Orbilia javanica TaxID=47235 RepID=A0AAN8RFG8_9PEZI
MQSRVPAMMVSILSNNIPVNIRPTLKVFSFRKDASPQFSTRAPPCLGLNEGADPSFFLCFGIQQNPSAGLSRSCIGYTGCSRRRRDIVLLVEGYSCMEMANP